MMNAVQMIQAVRELRALHGDESIILSAPGAALFDADRYDRGDRDAELAVLIEARATIIDEAGFHFCFQCGAENLGFDEIAEDLGGLRAICLDCAVAEPVLAE